MSIASVLTCLGEVKLNDYVCYCFITNLTTFIMIKKVLLPAFFFLLISCKKQSNELPLNTITATVDGVSVNFNTDAAAHRDSAAAGIINIMGETAAAAPKVYLLIYVEANNINTQVTSGSYTSIGYTSHSGVASLLYANIISDSQNGQDYATDINSNNNTSVTISSISSTSVQGTFSGKLTLYGDTTTRTITNGRFNVAFH